MGDKTTLLFVGGEGKLVDRYIFGVGGMVVGDFSFYQIWLSMNSSDFVGIPFNPVHFPYEYISDFFNLSKKN